MKNFLYTYQTPPLTTQRKLSLHCWNLQRKNFTAKRSLSTLTRPNPTEVSAWVHWLIRIFVKLIFLLHFRSPHSIVQLHWICIVATKPSSNPGRCTWRHVVYGLQHRVNNKVGFTLAPLNQPTNSPFIIIIDESDSIKHSYMQLLSYRILSLTVLFSTNTFLSFYFATAVFLFCPNLTQLSVCI